MDRKKRIAQVAETAEDAVLFAHVLERVERAQARGQRAATCFLTPREQVLAERLLGRQEGLGFFGGAPEAERRILYWAPEWEDATAWLTGAESPVVALRATYYEKDALTHRDLLGGLMGCGVKRETVGDLYVSQGSTDLLVLREVAPYLEQNFLSAGRTKLHVEKIALDALEIPAPQIKLIRDTVASLRLDSVVSSGFQLARGKAAALIAAGKCSLNNLPCEKTDKPVAEGDRISVRGLGKLELTQVGGNTKKGRIAIELTKYC